MSIPTASDLPAEAKSLENDAALAAGANSNASEATLSADANSQASDAALSTDVNSTASATEPCSAASLSADIASEASPTNASNPQAESASAPVHEHFGWALILTLLTAFFLLMAMPPFRWSGLAWVALVPFLLGVRQQGWKRGALLGLILGWIYHGLALYWLSRFGLFAPCLAGLIKSVFFIILGGVVGSIRPRSSLLFVGTVACAWIGKEYLEASGSLGFTLGMLANTQARHPLWIQINSLLGPWTLSFVIAFINAMLADWLWQVRWNKRLETKLERPGMIWQGNHPCFVTLCVACVLVAGTFAFGSWRLQHYNLESDKPLKVGLVQLSAPQGEKFRPDKAPHYTNELFNLSYQAAADGCDLVVWPETSLPYTNYAHKPRIRRQIERKVRKLDKWCLIGSVTREKGKKYNRMYLYSPHGYMVDTYDKYHLVPFGEYLPLEKYWPDWEILDQIMRFTPGKGSHCLRAAGCDLGLMICFESMTTTVPRAHVCNGAELLLIPTNDAWFDKTAELDMHFDMAIMRAVETGRYTMQSGNTGISGFITPLGEVIQESEANEKVMLSERVYAHTALTPYMRIGDIMPVLALLWVAIFMFDYYRQPKLFWRA